MSSQLLSTLINILTSSKLMRVAESWQDQTRARVATLFNSQLHLTKAQFNAKILLFLTFIITVISRQQYASDFLCVMLVNYDEVENAFEDSIISRSTRISLSMNSKKEIDPKL